MKFGISDKKGNQEVSSSFELKKPLVGFRWIFAFLGFTANFVVFFNRNSLPIALVAMVNSTNDDTETDYADRDTCPAAVNNTLEDDSEVVGEFSWTTSEQGIILGASTWGFMLVRLFGSRLVEVVGQREMVAMGIGVGGVTALLSPVCANVDPLMLAAIRFMLGAGYGTIPSALHSLISTWAPRQELSTMVSTVLSGSTFGGLVGYLISGWLSEAYGWRITFWIGGAISFIYLPFWLVLVRNSPREHPWISTYELNFLKENENVKTQKTVPWVKIMKSPYLHICISVHFARVWTDFLVSIEGPSFLTYKIGLDLSEASYVCAANYFGQLVFILVFGRISDFMVNKNIVKKVNARKIFHTLGSGGVGLALVFMALADCSTGWVIFLNILSGVLVNATGCSYFVSVIDLAPNFAATFMGFFALGNIGGALTPILTSFLLSQGNGWNKSFYVAGALNFASCLVYDSFMTAEAQPWNFDSEKKKPDIETEVTKF